MHPLFHLHDPGPWHPERPARAVAVERAVAASGAETVVPGPAPQAALERVHDPDHLAAIERLCRAGGGALDPDTVVGEPSWDAALHASGAVVEAVDAVLSGEIGSAFCGGRPPGHHAESDRAMGFCLVNHVAVGAAHARAASAERVAVLDWDAHHGNGTQAIFEDDPAVLYVSLHQWPFYPGTGAASERGTGAGEGATVNVPLPAGTSEAAYLEAFHGVAVPALQAFAPDLLLVSAGYDAHRDDPLCSLGLSSAAFGELTTAVAGIGAGPVLVLEGGYDLAALETGVAATLSAISRT
jgi:acetoin utilization deacetylase AcuC-like enzyme